MSQPLKVYFLLICLILYSHNSVLAEIKAPDPLWQILRTSRGDGHKIRYVAGDKDDGSFLVSLPYQVPQRFDSYKLYITPKYRATMLDKANQRVNKKIAKINEKIMKAKSKNKDTTKLRLKLENKKQDLYKAPQWDSNEDLSILHFARSVMGNYVPGKPIKHLILTKKDQLVCRPIDTQELNWSKEDKKYISSVYGYIPHKVANFALLVRYQARCITTNKAFKEILLFDSVTFDEDFAHAYGIPSYTKNAIKADL
jgi:hypothetical protein